MEPKPIKRGNFIIYKNKLLGQGSFASTYLATSATNPAELYACKIIDKKQADKKDNEEEREAFKKYFIMRLREEVKAWKELDHPNIVKFYETVESQNSIYMILEYCEGGYDHLYLAILKPALKVSSRSVQRSPSSTLMSSSLPAPICTIRESSTAILSLQTFC